MIQALARLERLQAQSRRGASRLKLSLDSSLGGSGDDVVIHIHDLSSTGILIETAANLRKNAQLEVDLPEIGATVATVVWSSGDFFGCQFAKPIPKAALSAALLRNPFEPAAVPEPVDEAADAEEFKDDRAPYAVRLLVIIGSAILLWALILWAVGVI